ncbi:hypothetical protein JYQ62_22085 [Nostoc sp. UHCC 0702]|nr:hypothetical protein JYQ62_22085 [Nostoc sp. UHCC 0702]
MMFSNQEVLQILFHLELNQQKLPLLNEALVTAIAVFEVEEDQTAYKQQVMGLVAELEQIRETAKTANNDDAGLIRADVLEWSESKPANIKKHKDNLRQRLAKLINWECPLCSVENCF